MALSTADLHSLVDFSKTSLTISLLAIAFNPTAWNIVARNEYKNKTITRILGGNARAGCYFLAVMIFSFGILRDSLYHRALEEQPRKAILPEPYATYVPAALFIVGQTLVITSTWALGITGTFLGDYFGILMDHRVEGFPFNILRDPMYVGSTMCFVAGALWYERPAGLLISLYVYIVYLIALRYEGPFTDKIYAKREEERAKGSKKQK
ncbi:putative catalyzes the second two steps of the methylation pathway of phosphatidylcholine biosynthesis, the SAM-dependent methylation of phosphatidylmonomethylethanolamine (PMME) to phosphatidyldimethylethanolamine (PDME) and of PDME to phosphatidylcholine (PC) [Lyophyllum shimeji]|uniref:Phosphatidyl-N-methylethanolamine N-methyltransferase n=1 Tax=Lyophyllum shimeji TaxID=47721 RepID=A0A9P3UQR5_LYOSH|nr:putative catalyzes the second two steps of the methylation pathway of phosphatidylcholine biosynthesis, the SAM-dependent methylation of phosphatidylmonomethylethanolamine (PMME) to phosphatidyldimethylethanolamine (PDME) and of PDME to phosphatidylcholine (PC) [Lyophyllum shimeji]